MIKWNETEAALTRIGNALQKPAKLTVIGSVISMSMGQAARMTMDVDVWRKASKFDNADLRQACEKAGVDFDPQGYVTADKLYVQLVDPGIVQLGVFDETETICQYGNLTISRPPIENIIASKMVRGEGKDYDDSVFLMRRCRIDDDQVRQAIESIKDSFSRETAMENFESMCMLLAYDQKNDRSPSNKTKMR